MYEDKTLNCVECGSEFQFTASEQEFYAEKGFSNEPKRCPDCRSSRKKGRFSGGGSGDRQMHDATCAECGASTKVPFKPTGERPVYCSDCFQKKRSNY
ncbi:MAG: zinc-ribbon domain containing protein [Clostridia bacterium]|nr:zinc-ribbon domain containing protein [Clostridia bacterium]MBN2883097.1 zinc-ribbon domain containing protein [Clostridia bacterium]